MAFEEIGIRLRTDGTVEATNGLGLVDKAVDGLGKTIVNTSPVVDALGKTVVRLVPGLSQVAPAIDKVTPAVDGLGKAVGGVAPEVAGLTGAITPMVAAFAAAAGVSFVLAKAFTAATAEAHEVQRAIILSGNAAGVTEGFIGAAAARVDAIVGTTAQASQILAQMVATGNISRNQLEQGTVAAISLQRTFGIEAEKTVKILSDLGKDPLKAAIRYNEQYRYLTLSTYEQIKALTEEGKIREAGALAQEGFAKAGVERSKEMEKNLGTLQKLWRGLGETASEAWDAILGIGRKKTTEQELAEIEKALAAPQRRAVFDPSGQQARRRQAMEDRRDELRQMLADQADGAALQAQITQRVQDKIAADAKKDKKPGREAADVIPYEALNDRITKRIQLYGAELAAGRKLTEAEQERKDLEEATQAQEAKFGPEAAAVIRQRIEATFRLANEIERQRKEAETEAEFEKKYDADRAHALQTAERELVTLEMSRDKLIEETAEIGLNARAVLERRQAKIDAEIASKQSVIDLRESIGLIDAETDVLRKQIVVLKESKAAQTGKLDAQEKQKEIDELKRRSDSVAASIEDGLVNGFRAGRGPADIFLREFKAQAAHNLLKIPIQLVADASTSLFSNLLGLGKLLGGAGGAGSGGLDASNIDGGSFNLPGRAGGGDVNAGGAFVVGEQGPELLFMGRQSGTVATAEKTRAALGGGGGRTVVFSPQIYIDSRTDRAEVFSIVQRGMQAAQADLLDKMDRREI